MSLTNKRGIFSLVDVRDRQRTNNWTEKSDVWEYDSVVLGSWPYGYAMGGSLGNQGDPYTQRINYDNDTAFASLRGILTFATQNGAATGNSFYSYYAGGRYVGNTGSAVSYVNRIDYSNDLQKPLIRGPLTSAANYLSATGNSNYGWFNLGSTPTVNRIDYSNDIATASPRGPIGGSQEAAATGNSFFGYFGGGGYSTPVSLVRRVDYSNDTTAASLRGPLSTARAQLAATGNSNFGWFGGGSIWDFTVTTVYSIVERIDYSNDLVTASPRGNLNTPKREFAATGNSNYGWFIAGAGSSPTASLVERVDYSNDLVTASPRGPLSAGKYAHSASSSQANGITNLSFNIPDNLKLTNLANPSLFTYNSGYFAGGSTTSRVERINYSNDLVTASIRGPLSANKYSGASTGNANYGWFGGGSNPNPSRVSTVDRIDYSNDTATASPRGVLSSARWQLSATGNSNFGWFGGGADPFSVSTVDRIDYSNDTASASPRGGLFGRRNHAATGNSNFGWFGGGDNTPTISSVDRITYSNDNATASPRGALSSARYVLSATGNSNYGWFGGGGPIPSGGPSFSTVDRIDYANDTVTASTRGPLSIAKRQHSATGNSSFGWFGAGTVPGSVSLVDRIDYSNDTATASPRGRLNAGRNRLMATSSGANGLSPQFSSQFSQYFFPQKNSVQVIPPLYAGYFAGGQSMSTSGFFSSTTVVDRLDYANDTEATSSRGSLSSSRALFAATGNSNYGWFGGGPVLAVDRIDYSNDTAVASPRGGLSSLKTELSATGNSNFGWFGGGYNNSIFTTISSVDRMDFSNDTATASPRGALSSARYRLAAAGNSNYGWVFGGGSPISSRIDRIDYSNDTATASLRGPLSSGGKRQHTATGNSNYGWVIGGDSPSAFLPTNIDRVDYSNDTATASPRGPLGFIGRNFAAATGNSSYGYVGGGEYGSIPNIERIDYANDTAIASVRSFLNTPRNRLAASSATANGLPQIINLSVPVVYKGYFGGGFDGPATRSTVDRIDYSNDTATASARGVLTIARYDLSATGNSNYGWFGGGNIGSPTFNTNSRIDRINYSNDTATASSRGEMSVNRQNYHAIGNLLYGWFAGGNVNGGPDWSSIDRVDYSNDIVTASPRGVLTENKTGGGATGNSNYGWIGGAFTGSRSLVERVDYSNDIATASIRGPLTGDRYFSGATGNSNYGWFGGGGTGILILSSVDRIDYANDTVTASPRGLLTLGRRDLSATGNSTFGYFGGGQIPSPNAYYSTIDRINYSNDTTTASPRGSLSGARGYMGATSPTINGFPQ